MTTANGQAHVNGLGEPLHAPKRNVRIAIVDDDAAVRDSLLELLSTFGFQVSVYESASDFIDKIPGDAYDCLFVDQHMPGMTGLELIDVLRGRDFKVPIIMLTAHQDSDFANRVLAAGVIALLRKPAQVEELIRYIELATGVR